MKYLIILSLIFLTSCKQEEVITPKVDTAETVSTVEETPKTDLPEERISLYWENTTEPHPERKPWSDKLTGIISKDLPQYLAAKDITSICKKIGSLTKQQQVKAISEFWVATAYYESSFNPNSNSVDVGSRSDKGSWSVGLYQMSANDGAAQKYKATFESLKDPLVNIEVATEQMRRQLKNTSTILLPNSSKFRYWAVLLQGNRYSQIPKILARVQKQAPFCN